MGTQQFCLKWNNHQTNMLAVFEQLLSSEALVDVTLACDGLSLKAHKMVLSACSPFFQSLFLENPCKHPIVILKDMRYTDLKAIIDFMYRGEVNVSQDQLSALLKTAETLKVKGLAEVTGEQRQGASGVIQQEIVQQTVTTQALPLTSAQQQRAESPPLSRRKRGRPRRRSLSDSNRSDTEDQVPSKIKEPDSPEVVEDISRDGSDVSCEIRQRLSAPNHPQSQVSTHPIPHSSVLSSVSNQKPVTTVSSVQDSQVTVEEPPSGDETEFEMEPSKLMEQSMTTDNVPVFSDGPSQGPSLPPVSNQLAIPTTVGLVDTQPLHTTGPCGDSQALIPCSLPSEPSTSSQLSQDTTQDIKPSALVSYEEPPISPVAGPSHQDSSSSMMMYMETSAIAGPSNYQLDKQSQPHQQSQPQGTICNTEDWCLQTTSGTSRLDRRCNICNKIFTRRQHLRRHMKCHNDVREIFPCHICKKVLSRPDHLRRHHLMFHMKFGEHLRPGSFPNSLTEPVQDSNLTSDIEASDLFFIEGEDNSMSNM